MSWLKCIIYPWYLDYHNTTDLVKSLYEQIDLIKREVLRRLFARGAEEKKYLWKIVVTSQISETVDGSIEPWNYN